MIFYLKIVISNFYQTGYYYDWTYITVNEDNGKFLDYVNYICSESGYYADTMVDPIAAAQLIYDYLDSASIKYEQQKKEPILNYMMQCLIDMPQHYASTHYRESINELKRSHYKNRKESNSIYYYTYEKLVSQFEERYFKALENQNQKQLNYN